MNLHRCDRRAFLRGSAGLLLAAAAVPARAAAGPPPDVDFNIYREGGQVGTYTLRFAPDGDGFTTRMHMELAIKVAFVTVYRYRQDGEERWQAGRLVGASYDTDDNGKVTHVEVRRDGEGLGVSGPKGRYEAEATAMTDAATWNKAITRRERVIDSQNGEYATVQVAGPTSVRLQVGGRTVQADRFDLQGSNDRDGSLWFDGNDRWLQGRVHTRGQVFEFRPPA